MRGLELIATGLAVLAAVGLLARLLLGVRWRVAAQVAVAAGDELRKSLADSHERERELQRLLQTSRERERELERLLSSARQENARLQALPNLARVVDALEQHERHAAERHRALLHALDALVARLEPATARRT